MCLRRSVNDELWHLARRHGLGGQFLTTFDKTKYLLKLKARAFRYVALLRRVV